MQRKVDPVWVLYPIIHGLALPPRLVVVIIEIRQIVGGMGQLRLRRVAQLARLLRLGDARLEAVLGRSLGGLAAGVGRLDAHVEGGVHELGDAPQRPPELVLAAALLVPSGVDFGEDQLFVAVRVLELLRKLLLASNLEHHRGGDCEKNIQARHL